MWYKVEGILRYGFRCQVSGVRQRFGIIYPDTRHLKPDTFCCERPETNNQYPLLEGDSRIA